jgi:probable FeS assembly SUF system protein SufT
MRIPVIRISDRARKEFLDARAAAADDAGGDSLRLTISPRFEADLFFGSKAESDLAVDCDGIAILLDAPSAARADGISIDFVEGRNGSGFKIDNPNKPETSKQPKQIELKRDCEAALIPSGEKVQLSLGERVLLTQALGGSYTVQTDMGRLARIAAQDADALGFEVKPASPVPDDGTGSFDLQQVIAQLKTVFDPEIPVNVVDLGLVYACDAHPIEGGGQRVEIKMSMTAPGCGMGDVLKQDARARVQTVPGVTEVDIEIVWDPPWDKGRMSEAARLQLGML